MNKITASGSAKFCPVSPNQFFLHLFAQRLKYRQKIADAFAFVDIKIMMYYDSRYMPLLFNDLKLYHGYEFQSRFNNNFLLITMWAFSRFQENKKINI